MASGTKRSSSDEASGGNTPAIKRIVGIVSIAREMLYDASAERKEAERLVREMEKMFSPWKNTQGDMAPFLTAVAAQGKAEKKVTDATHLLTEIEECLREARTNEEAPIKRARAGDVGVAKNVFDLASTCLLEASNAGAGIEDAKPHAPKFVISDTLERVSSAACARFVQTRLPSSSEWDSQWIFFKEPTSYGADRMACVDSTLVYADLIEDPSKLSKVRLVLSGGCEWDQYTSPPSDDAFVITLRPEKAMDAFIYIALQMHRPSIPEEMILDASDCYGLTNAEGILAHVLREAKSVDVLCLCSELYRNTDVEEDLACALAHLLCWGRMASPRVSFTVGGWAAQFMSAHFLDMTGVVLGRIARRSQKSTRNVKCVVDVSVARNCPLTALALVASCAFADTNVELTIAEMESGTYACNSDRDVKMMYKTTTYMRQAGGNRRAVVWTTEFGDDAPMPITWSTKHISDVRGVRNVDPAASATSIAAVFDEGWGRAIRTCSGPYELSAVLTRAFQRLPPGSHI